VNGIRGLRIDGPNDVKVDFLKQFAGFAGPSTQSIKTCFDQEKAPIGHDSPK